MIWKTKVPGRGHASPIIVGGRIFLSTADEQQQSQSVVCFDQSNGKQIWETEVSSGGFNKRVHPNNSQASATVATDGKHVFAVFSHDGETHVSALDLDGKLIWSEKVGVYQPKFPFGYGASPIMYKSNVIVTNENQGDSAVVAFDANTGKLQWKIDREGVTSFSTPVIATVAGKEQMLLSGGMKVTSYDPSNGKKLWQSPTRWLVTCGTMVWDGDMVFASGGYPSGQTVGVNAKSGEKLWDNPAKVYEQSMLAVDGYVYAHADNGVIYCWQASDGQEMWKQKFSKARVGVSASPVLANGNLYFTAENGETVVAEATPNEYVEVARNRLGDSAFASLAISGDRIYARVGDSREGSRQEWLYCLGEKQDR